MWGCNRQGLVDTCQNTSKRIQNSCRSFFQIISNIQISNHIRIWRCCSLGPQVSVAIYTRRLEIVRLSKKLHRVFSLKNISDLSSKVRQTQYFQLFWQDTSECPVSNSEKLLLFSLLFHPHSEWVQGWMGSRLPFVFSTQSFCGHSNFPSFFWDWEPLNPFLKVHVYVSNPRGSGNAPSLRKLADSNIHRAAIEDIGVSNASGCDMPWKSFCALTWLLDLWHIFQEYLAGSSPGAVSIDFLVLNWTFTLENPRPMIDLRVVFFLSDTKELNFPQPLLPRSVAVGVNPPAATLRCKPSHWLAASISYPSSSGHWCTNCSSFTTLS